MKKNQNSFDNSIDFQENINSIQEVVQPAYDGNVSSKKNYSEDQVKNFINDWMDKPKELALWMIDKYGLPQEATAQRLIWHNNGEWKYSMVENAEIPHDFPYPHVESLTQVINFRMNTYSCSTEDLSLQEEKVANLLSRTKGELSSDQIIPNYCRDISWFNGSINMDRTKGELSIRSSSEAFNFLSANLVQDIICGKRTVSQAREFYGDVANKMRSGQTSNYTQGLLFITPNDYVGDTDFDLEEYNIEN